MGNLMMGNAPIAEQESFTMYTFLHFYGSIVIIFHKTFTSPCYKCCGKLTKVSQKSNKGYKQRLGSLISTFVLQFALDLIMNEVSEPNCN